MASPWGKIEKIEPTNFAEIMSEEYARGLQDKENKKYVNHVRDNILKQARNVEKNCDKSLDDDDDDDDGGTNKTIRNIEIVPEDVLKVMQENATSSNAILNEVCDSDVLIAQVLQAQFDHEYNEELKRIEKQKNKQSKVSVSLNKYRRPTFDDQDSDDNFDDDFENQKCDWDRFETNEKKFDAIPRCGFMHDGEGSIVTKHDPQICGVRNACRVMSFPPEFPTGDGAGFDMKLSNAVYNQLKSTNAKVIKRDKRASRKENKATAEMGIDARTRLLLFKLINKQILEQVNGIISTGKEAVILHANSDPSYTGELVLPKECAIKIFKTTLNEFKQRDRYIEDDYRFKDRKHNGAAIIDMWAEKEMHNIMRMKKCGINCPNVVVLKKHILVMSFIGDNHNAAPKLKDALLNDAELNLAYEEIVQMMYKLYNEANLVHADLSEYNILWFNEKCWIIDVAQSVEPKHPSALEFLMRDCDNIITFFSRKGLPNIYTKEQLFEYITSLNAQTLSVAMLERIYTPGVLLKDTVTVNVPDEKKPISYPFDLAWEKSMDDRKNSSISHVPVFDCKTDENFLVESTDALKVLNIQCPIECNGEK